MNAMRQREQWMWVSLGGTMLLPLLWKRSALTLAFGAGGGYVAVRAAQGASPIAWRGPRRGMETITRAVTIQASPERIYAEWRKVEEMPRYFPVLQEVRALDPQRSKWRMRLGGKTLEWETEITQECPNERLAWRSVPGAGVQEHGWIRLKGAPDERGTILEMSMQLAAPGAGALLPLLTPAGIHPEQIMREGLRRFKQWMETGEIATIEGQSHGPRSPVAKLLPYFEPGRPQWATRQAAEPVRRTGTR